MCGECLTEREYAALYEHGLGGDCIAETPDDDDIICPPDFEFEQEICQCISTDFCNAICPDNLMPNPLTCGECLTEGEYSELFMHGLGSDCKAGTDDDND